VRIDSSLSVLEVIEELKERFGIQEPLDFGLYIPSENTWLKRNRNLREYTQLASEKIDLQLKEFDARSGSLKKQLVTVMNSISLALSEVAIEGYSPKVILDSCKDYSKGPSGFGISYEVKIEGGFQQKLFNDSNSLRALSLQLLSGLQAITNETEDYKNYVLLLQLLSTVKQFPLLITSILNTLECYVMVVRFRLQASNDTPEVLSELSLIEDEENIWKPENVKLVLNSDNSIKGRALRCNTESNYP